MNLKTDKTPAEIAAMTYAEYRAEVDRLMAAAIADFAAAMDSHRTAGTSLARRDGTGSPDHDCRNCD